MTSITKSLRQLSCQRPSLASQLASSKQLPLAIRTISNTSTSTPAADAAKQDAPSGSMTPLQAAFAAHPAPFNNQVAVRTVPATPSYFTRQPVFNDLFIQLNTLLTKYHHLPTSAAAELNPVPWLKLQDLRERMGEPIKSSQFSKVMRIAKRLQMIDDSLRPAEVNLVLGSFQRTIDSRLNKAKAAYIDKFGRAVGTGRRKASKARAFVVEGTGEMLVNGKPLSEAFGRVHDRESALWALKATERLDKYNVWALVEGGGTTGQAEAITLAVAKGLLAHEPALKPALRSAGCVTRDPRAVERKKHGHVKARKSPTWVKR